MMTPTETPETVSYRRGKEATMQFMINQLTAFTKTHPATIAMIPREFRMFFASFLTDTLAFVKNAEDHVA